jgi:hypothetical protein
MDREAKRSGDIQSVHCWVCLIRGSESQIAIRATEHHARRWVEANVGRDKDAEWTANADETRLSYRPESGTKTGSVELCIIPDAAGMIVADDTA